MATTPPRRRRTPPPPPRRHRPVPRAPKPTRWRRLAVLLALPLLAIGSTVGLRVVYLDRALPGTELAGTNVEGDSRDVLKERMTRLAAAPVTVFAAGRQLRITPVAAGYEQDVNATVAKVLDEGRHGPLLGLTKTAAGLFSSRNVVPVDRVDPVKMDATTRAVARLVNRSAYPGGITVDPVSLAVGVQGPRQGRTVDRKALARQLVVALRSGLPTFRAPFQSSRVATTAAVRRVASAAERYLAQPLTLAVGGEPVVVTPEKLAPILRLRASRKDRTQVRLGSDEARLTA
ncbi:MAG: Vancomycin B-type resistance protein VanW, partial [Solirubrobacterales bacterium]|nr:Vancomycin B-type resistance protein VanW [Solirubrobacterales bacterium]